MGWLHCKLAWLGKGFRGSRLRACDESDDLVKNSDDFILGEPFSTGSVALDTRELCQPH
jgi:hypothetical protein